LDKLRLQDKRRRQQEVRVRVLRYRRILLPEPSSQLRRDSNHLRRTCHRDSNRHRRQENLAPQANLLPQANPECLAQRPVPEQSVQQVLLQPPRRVLLPLLHPLRKSLLVF
jgi:hypothetical protein